MWGWGASGRPWPHNLGLGTAGLCVKLGGYGGEGGAEVTECRELTALSVFYCCFPDPGRPRQLKTGAGKGKAPLVTLVRKKRRWLLCCRVPPGSRAGPVRESQSVLRGRLPSHSHYNPVAPSCFRSRIQSAALARVGVVEQDFGR